ncbi:protein disulfide-isomerase 2-like isoform X2 [Aphis craccivora]|uniref:Protein disulfide-isomerase 2-like isoform X2 n=1 Tax=Aphis craccivora TaxID=307492 RepID=A0A6G0ZA62_APHCR|nr:protein disulfide-isomerase 2-like isoform X2 [Aphis craccivora]
MNRYQHLTFAYNGFSQALFLAVLAVSSWPSTTGNDNDNGNSNNVVWQNIPGGRHVRILDETNFQQTITENCCVLVFFHAKCE